MRYKTELILFALWLLVQSLLLFKYGIITNNEAVKYHRKAENIIKHKSFSESKYILYSVCIFIHALFLKLNIETAGVYIFQLLLNLFAINLFYNYCCTYTKKKELHYGLFIHRICFLLIPKMYSSGKNIYWCYRCLPSLLRQYQH